MTDQNPALKSCANADIDPIFSEGSKVIRIAHQHAKECESFRKALQNISTEAVGQPSPQPKPEQADTMTSDIRYDRTRKYRE